MKALLFITLLLSTTVTYALNTAELHVSKMLNMYSSLVEYEDAGNTTIKFVRSDNNTYIENKTFETHYNKNQLLKFKWVALPTNLDKESYSLTNNDKYLQPKKYTVWKDGTGIYTQYRSKEKKSQTNLTTALSGATGISNGLAWLVPRFLSSEISCAPNLNATESKIINETTKIITIKQILPSGNIRVLHINKDTYLLKKYELISELASGTKTHQLSSYNVKKYK